MSEDEVRRYRDEIREVDHVLTAALNRRAELVAELKRFKEANGIPFVDQGREVELIEERLRDNAGPISEEGLRAFYVELLALIKREV
jgi:chorismate mutase / prephenate dehydratase